MSDEQARFPNLLEVLPDPGDATKQTLELLWRAAPEQVREFDEVFASGIQARLLKGKSPILGVTYNVLQIPEEVLVQLWLLTHAAWKDFCTFQKRKDGKDIQEDKASIAEVVAIASAIGNDEHVVWPSWIPTFREAREGVEAKAIREMWAMACAWALMHEVQHAKLFEDEARPADPISEELMCDAYASEILFGKTAEYSKLTGEEEVKVRDKRAIASLVGLYFVGKLSKEGSESTTHPPFQDRVKLLFDKVDSQPLNHFWDFALALICEIKPEINSRKVEAVDPSSRDLAYTALNYAFGGN